jgi:hypothetical protein
MERGLATAVLSEFEIRLFSRPQCPHSRNKPFTSAKHVNKSKDKKHDSLSRNQLCFNHHFPFVVWLLQ